MTQLTDNGIYSIKIPADATDIVLHNNPPKLVFSSAIQDPAQCGGDIIALSPGSYEFLFCTKGCSEDDARKMAGLQHHNFKEWYVNFEGRNYFTQALPSLNSLLRSKGCEGNHAIIKKLNP